jgi:hypothetical protein
MTTDTTERGLERLICTALTGHPCDPAKPDWVGKPPTAYGGLGWIGGTAQDYDREYCVDLAQLAAFLLETQPEAAEALAIDEDGPTRRKFLARLQGEIARRGTIDVLRHGSSTGRIISTSSTARRHPGMRGPPSATKPTASASRGSSATAATRPNSLWTCASSSTACR